MFRYFCLLAILAAACLTSPTQAGIYKTITIDGDTADWAGVPVAHSDQDDSLGAEVVDWKDVYMANDVDYLYVRITLWTPADASGFQSNYYLDGDNDDTTGYHVFGSPDFGSSLLMQSGAGYQQAGGGFNEGSLAGSATIFAPLFAGAGTDFEFRIDRNVVGVQGTFTGLPLITSNTVKLQLQSDAGDVAPNGITGIEYTFAVVPEPTSLALTSLAFIGMIALHYFGVLSA